MRTDRVVTPATTLQLFAIVCTVLGVVPLANWMSGGHAVPWWPLAVQEWAQRGLVVIALAALLAILLPARVDEALRRARFALLQPSGRAFGLAMAALAFAAAAFLAQFCFAGQPFTSDELAQQWHARILLSGHLFAAPEAHREFFNTAPVLDQGAHWFSQYPLGSSAFIALGIAAGAAWLVNPLLLAFGTWQLYRFGSLASDELTARLTTVLFVLSPMVLIMAASQMNHVPALAFTLLALASLARWEHADDPRSQRRHAAILGLAIGVVTTVRPLDGVMVAVVIAGYQLWRCSSVPVRWRSIVTQVLLGAFPVAVLLWANARTTGSPLLFGYEALNGPEHGIGFHVDPNGEAHTPTRGLLYVSGYLLRLNRYLLEWPVPGLLVIVAGLLASRRPGRWDVLLTALAMGFLLAYGAYWFDGFFAGPRFLFTVAPVFIYFAARAPLAIAGAVRHPAVQRTVLLIVPLCLIATWAGPFGVSSGRARVALFLDQRTKLKTDIDAQIERAGLHNALVLVNEPWRGRLVARLRTLGITQFRAERILNGVDACALQTALDAEDSLPARNLGERAERVLQRSRAFGEARLQPAPSVDQTIAIVPGSTPTATCLHEFQRDAEGTMPYGLFLARQEVGPDGRIGGDVVFARDLGERNELLRERFGDRTWYRYRAGSGPQDSTAAFIAYRSTR